MWYLKSAFDTYEKVQDAMVNRLTDVQSAVLSPVDAIKRFLGGAAPPASTAKEAELDALQKRVAELEARLQNAPPHRSRKRTKGH